jgi:hypothetical protein
MQIYGLDFTSAPGRKKPLIVLGCQLEDGSLRIEGSQTLTDFGGFEDFLRTPGPWICGMDFPFGQPRSLVAALGWPQDWEGYVGKVGELSKDEFEDEIRADMATRPPGSKWRYRLADRRSHSSSAMMLFRVPVGKMFYRGRPASSPRVSVSSLVAATGTRASPSKPTRPSSPAASSAAPPTSGTPYPTRPKENLRERRW